MLLQKALSCDPKPGRTTKATPLATPTEREQTSFAPTFSPVTQTVDPVKQHGWCGLGVGNGGNRLTDRFLVTYPNTTNGTGIYAYIDPQNHPNVGMYAIHGVSGIVVICSNAFVATT